MLRAVRNPRGLALTAVSLVWVLAAFHPVAAADPRTAALEQQLANRVRPLLQMYCFGCHGEETQEAKLNLSTDTTLAEVAANYLVWQTVSERLVAQTMPPEDADRMPTADERKLITDWIQSMRDSEAQRRAGDPGLVLARRLSNAELDYTIRDLTGVDLRPTREFPVDPANAAGFDNSGESLAMSPALLKKYLLAARYVADHVVLKPKGFTFAPHPVVTDTDRDKYCVQRIVDFYGRYEIHYADYLLAAWRYQHREVLGTPNVSLAEHATEAGISPLYLAKIWNAFAETEQTSGPLAVLQASWRALPTPMARQRDLALPGCQELDQAIMAYRARLKTTVEGVELKGISPGSQPLVLWKNQQLAENRLRYTGSGIVKDTRSHTLRLTTTGDEITLRFVVGPAEDGGDNDYLIWRSGRFQNTSGKSPEPKPLRELLQQFAPEQIARLSFGKDAGGRPIDADSFGLKAPADVAITIPSSALFETSKDNVTFAIETTLDPVHFRGGAVQVACEARTGPSVADVLAREPLLMAGDDPQVARLEAAFQDFCRLCPDEFFLAERAPYFAPDSGNQGRLLTAGFHLMQGYFRDDRPLYELILDEPARHELDALWQELNFVTLVPLRQYKDFIFFERAEPPRFMQEAEFDFARSEDRSATTAANLQRLAEAYLAKARRIGATERTITAIEAYFANISAEIRWVEESRLAAEATHLSALRSFAQRAYRRPLTDAEHEDLLAFYQARREIDGLGHEDAIRDTLASILVSPHFCYRVDPAEPGNTPQPLSPHSLASRLSYFLWSSMPDEELLSHAAAGDLHRPEVLVAQTRRLLSDARVRGLATEFGGQWLDFRRFEEHNSVDRQRFPAFDDKLRQAMFEEPVRFFLDVVREDRSVLDFLYAEHTFVNPELARHYGIPWPPRQAGGPAEESEDWVRVDDARGFGRGGLLPMSVFLTKNAPGLRTSPVKRGYWVVRRLLGEQIPAPPPNVPELPPDEARLGELTLRQTLAHHRELKNCAACHERFDSIGLVFENYGPIGERRDHDLGGRQVDTQAVFPNGSSGRGLEGLLQYLRAERQDEFIDNLCRKLLVYALGRNLLLSDEPLIDNMRTRLAADGYRFSELVELIVTSPQFLNKRGRDE